MAIVVTCEVCNTRLTLGDDRAGDRFECPQCDATIKVPGPAQPPARAPAATAAAYAKPARATRRPEPESDFDPEPEHGPDKRVIGGIIAGVAALLLVGVAVVVFAVRKPAETAQQAPEPSTPVVAPPALAPPKKPIEVPQPKQPVDTQPIEPPGQPAGPMPSAQPQFIAQFLGSQAKGRRFCVIADNSGSMSRNIPDLRTQLLKTITDLNADSEFYIFAFNSVAEPMPHAGWLKAGAPETGKIKTWVNAISSRGGTNPAPAFEAAFKLNPPPDVIFFMTDGQFANTVPARVVALNGTPPKTLVNTIMFTNAPAPKGGVVPKFAPGGAEALLKQIAEQNRGTFTRYAPP